MSKNIYITLLVSSTLLLAAPSHAGVFKWIDANGLTHYSDKAPKHQPSQSLKQHSGVVYDLELIGKKPIKRKATPQATPTLSVPVMTPLNKPDLFAVEYDIRKTAIETKRTPINNVRQKLCTDARMQLAALNEAGHSGYFDEEGNYRLAWGADIVYQGPRRYLTDQQTNNLSKTVGVEVEQYCRHPYDQDLQNEARASWIRAEYCAVNKAFLRNLQAPSKRTSTDEINNQLAQVERFCAELGPDEHRGDERYYPTVLRSKFINSWRQTKH